jgi:hypothetical protein
MTPLVQVLAFCGWLGLVSAMARYRVVQFVALLATLLSGCAVINKLDGVSQAQELHKSGVLAESTILEIWETGTTVNDDPVVGFLLEVHPRDGDVYRAKTKLLISRLAIPQIQPGAVVPVRYDAANRPRVSLDLNSAAGFMATTAPTPPPPAVEVEAERRRLLETGVAGNATILECHPLGLFDADGRPVYDLLLSIDVPGRAPRRGPTRVGVTRDPEHWFHTGQQLPIKADPADPIRFAVDWDRLE